MGQVWAGESSLIWTRYPDSDDWVVYHPLAGTVHGLTDAAHHLLALTSERPRDEAELLAALARRFEDISIGDLEAVLRDALATMNRAGLVRPVAA